LNRAIALIVKVIPSVDIRNGKLVINWRAG
jgi:hypothetical protein